MRVLPTLVAAALIPLLGCSDNPLTGDVDTASLTAGESSEATAKGATLSDPRSEWIEIDQIVYTGTEWSEYYPCANDNDGEEMWAIGTYKLYIKDVLTPSGQYRMLLKWLLSEDGGFVGDVSGDTWLQVHHGYLQIGTLKSTDGGYYVEKDQIVELYENQDGDRLKATWWVWVEYDDGFNLTDFDIALRNCTWLGPQ